MKRRITEKRERRKKYESVRSEKKNGRSAQKCDFIERYGDTF